MTRDIPSSLEVLIGAQANKPVELFEVSLDTGTLYFAAHIDHLVFGTQTYTALGIRRSPVRTSAELEVDQLTLELANTDLAFSQRIVATDFIGKNLVVKKVDLDALDDPSAFVIIFDGKIDEPVLDQDKLAVKVRSWLDALHHSLPRRVFSTVCNYQHYDAFCAASRELGTNLVTGTAIGSSTTRVLVASVLATNSDLYWGPIGTLTMKSGSNATIGREVTSHSQADMAAIVRIPFDFFINSGDVFEITRGCRKTVSDCQSKYDNYLNYGGFPTTPKHPLI